MTKEDVMSDWEESWSSFEGHRKLGNFFLKNARNIALRVIDNTGDFKHRKPRIIDIGCGAGDTIYKFKQFGYKNIIGIDYAQSSILLCQRNGLKINEDVFQMDAFKTKFEANSFDIVFSEGLLEHFDDFYPIVKEMCRISKMYVLVIQPNHYSSFKKISDLYYFIFSNKNNVKEYTYCLNEFQNSFREFGFTLDKKETSLLGAFWILLFKRQSL